MTINLDDQPHVNAQVLGDILAECGQPFRNPMFRSGLLCEVDGRCFEIRTAKQLGPLVADLLDISVIKGGELKGRIIPNGYLELLLGTQCFRDCFLPVDSITQVPGFDHEFNVLKRGHNPGPPGARIYYSGQALMPANSLDATNRFLDEMDFESEADRTGVLQEH